MENSSPSTISSLIFNENGYRNANFATQLASSENDNVSRIESDSHEYSQTTVLNARSSRNFGWDNNYGFMDMEIIENTNNLQELGTQANRQSQASNENHQLVTANSFEVPLSFQLSSGDLQLTPKNGLDQMKIGISTVEPTSLHSSEQK